MYNTTKLLTRRKKINISMVTLILLSLYALGVTARVGFINSLLQFEIANISVLFIVGLLGFWVVWMLHNEQI